MLEFPFEKHTPNTVIFKVKKYTFSLAFFRDNENYPFSSEVYNTPLLWADKVCFEREHRSKEYCIVLISPKSPFVILYKTKTCCVSVFFKINDPIDLLTPPPPPPGGKKKKKNFLKPFFFPSVSLFFK